MYIAYDIKNGVEYAKLVKSNRKGTKVVKEYSNLRRVLDKKLGIYKNRKLFQRAKDNRLSEQEVYDKMEHHGIFVILSSRKIAVQKILSIQANHDMVNSKSQKHL